MPQFSEVDRNPFLFVLEEGILLAECIEHRLEPGVLDVVRFVVEAIVGNAQAREHGDLPFEAQVGHRAELLADLVITLLDPGQ